jgi:hypothetical protein
MSFPARISRDWHDVDPMHYRKNAHRAVRRRPASGHTTGPTERLASGDPQYRNIMWSAGWVVAVLDWDRLRVQTLAEELVRTATIGFVDKPTHWTCTASPPSWAGTAASSHWTTTPSTASGGAPDRPLAAGVPLPARQLCYLANATVIVGGAFLARALAPSWSGMAQSLIASVGVAALAVVLLTGLRWWRAAGFNRPAEWRDLSRAGLIGEDTDTGTAPEKIFWLRD